MRNASDVRRNGVEILVAWKFLNKTFFDYSIFVHHRHYCKHFFCISLPGSKRQAVAFEFRVVFLSDGNASFPFSEVSEICQCRCGAVAKDSAK